MTPAPVLEIAANSVTSALAAQVGGADRIELCCALELGGLTPSYAQTALARERLQIPIHVLIRPRAGDFLYSDDECDTMLRDVEACAALGCEGVVLGVLDAEGHVDQLRMAPLVSAAKARGLGVTFHRAIDVARDPLQALDAIIALGCERILSSGGQASAPQGAALLRAMVERAAGRIIVMPGAGIDAGNLARLRADTGAVEFHASAKRQRPSGMVHVPAASLGMDAGETFSDADLVRGLVAALGT